MTPTTLLRAAFLLSGVAGLVHEVLWSRYLGLYVGHGAYAQVLVLAVYLGGMAVGSVAIADVSKKIANPLRWYAGAELVLAAFGLAFHLMFTRVTGWTYDVAFPAVAGASWVGSVRWAVAGAMILPQSIVLGTTFPLMAAGLVRRDRGRPGSQVAEAYLLNTLGGAVGVLLAGFVFIGAFGLPGTSVAAAVLNGAAGALVLVATRGRQVATANAPVDAVAESADPGRPADPATERDAAEPEATSPADAHDLPAEGGRLLPVLLTVACGTAIASFAYEIGWIRMLSLVLGSATHAFELMLSAFILGIALGSFLIRRHTDRTDRPVRLLGGIQVAMGLTALLSLPVYLLSFGAVSAMIASLSGQPDGYAIFNIGRYALCLIVMLPSTVLAGCTLPLITGTLLRAGAAERTIGHVYGINTFGSVVGAGLAGLLALPILGLEGLIAAGAALDVVLGLWMLERSARWSGVRPALAARALAVSAFIGAAVLLSVDFNPNTITSGVYRRGDLTESERWRSLYYEDGRTATVSAHVGTGDGVVVLATNGKPDASLGPRWIMDGRDTLPVRPIPQGRDFTTQALAPMVTLAHRPNARSVANVGHGSGMTATSFLTSESLERLVTIEIEPFMVEGSLVFLPANAPAFADPRVTYVFDDAKSYFSYQRERFDIIFAEPSNPWVSGTASLFTKEFYERVTDFMADGGVLGQWIQVYELNDDLFLSVLAALDSVFPYYRAYLVGDADVAIVARLDGPLGEPDWSVVESTRFRTMTTSAPPFERQHMEAMLLFDQDTFRPILDRNPPVNSDYYPILDLGAERTRFDQSAAEGVFSFAISRVDLTRQLAGAGLEPTGYATPPAYGLSPVMLREMGAWLRESLANAGGISPEDFPEWQDELVHLQQFLTFTRSPVPLTPWDSWASSFMRAEVALHRGTSGFVEPIFYRSVRAFLDRTDAPEPARAVVDLMFGYALSDWARTASAADELVPRTDAGEYWIPADILLDVAVLAYLEVGRPDAAMSAWNALADRTGRAPWNLRNRLLRAMIEDAR